MKPLTQPGLRKYAIGLGVIMVFVVVLLVLVVVKAGAAKADAKTYKAAGAAAGKLNDYISEKQQIPASLAAAGVRNAPDSVTYTKLSDSKYRFCVTYKSGSTGFDASTVGTDLLTARTGGAADELSSTNLASDSAYLYVNYTHHKGANCQTIEPYLYNAGGLDGGNDSCPYPQNASDKKAYNEYYQCLDQAYLNGSSSSDNLPLTYTN